jgi:hypothetical protein
MQRVQQVLDRPLELNRRKMREPSGLSGRLPDPRRQVDQVCHNSGSICRRDSCWGRCRVGAKLDDVCHADQESVLPVKAECGPADPLHENSGARDGAKGKIAPAMRYAASPHILVIVSPPIKGVPEATIFCRLQEPIRAAFLISGLRREA